MTPEQEMQLKASESAVALAKLQTENETIMRHPAPSKIQLAILQSNCMAAQSLVQDIYYWAASEYRKLL